MRALSSNGQPPAMTQSPIATDVHQALDVHLNLLAQVSLDSALRIDDSANAVYFLFRQLANPLINADFGFSQDLVCPRAADAINVCQTDLSSFISWQVHTC